MHTESQRQSNRAMEEMLFVRFWHDSIVTLTQRVRQENNVSEEARAMTKMSNSS